jgi:hypothetical protein
MLPIASLKAGGNPEGSAILTAPGGTRHSANAAAPASMAYATILSGHNANPFIASSFAYPNLFPLDDNMIDAMAWLRSTRTASSEAGFFGSFTPDGRRSVGFCVWAP